MAQRPFVRTSSQYCRQCFEGNKRFTRYSKLVLNYRYTSWIIIITGSPLCFLFVSSCFCTLYMNYLIAWFLAPDFPRVTHHCSLQFITSIYCRKISMEMWKNISNCQQTFTCSRSTIETLEKSVKYVQS